MYPIQINDQQRLSDLICNNIFVFFLFFFVACDAYLTFGLISIKSIDLFYYIQRYPVNYTNIFINRQSIIDMMKKRREKFKSNYQSIQIDLESQIIDDHFFFFGSREANKYFF